MYLVLVGCMSRSYTHVPNACTGHWAIQEWKELSVESAACSWLWYVGDMNQQRIHVTFMVYQQHVPV